MLDYTRKSALDSRVLIRLDRWDTQLAGQRAIYPYAHPMCFRYCARYGGLAYLDALFIRPSVQRSAKTLALLRQRHIDTPLAAMSQSTYTAAFLLAFAPRTTAGYTAVLIISLTLASSPPNVTSLPSSLAGCVASLWLASEWTGAPHFFSFPYLDDQLPDGDCHL
eukprot:NODE_5979_length_891_cov_54.940104_g5750_i0.p1 GENE.NODE_5979_length_891_cov_54.940104_g5750_i0~~NODE_5979_length_891_cov_54.940104_g5750_i0.p1  ORF type:complete len:165 (-),score=5.15 NODE_5979_length_891_cov_54.940104_g5750_i0:244-738(-)